MSDNIDRLLEKHAEEQRELTEEEQKLRDDEAVEEAEEGSDVDNDDDLDGSDGWDEEEIDVQCLFCEEVVLDFDTHLREKHMVAGGSGGELRSAILAPSGAKEIYERIKVINFIRGAVADLKCPASCSEEAFASAEALGAHMAKEQHFAPTTLPEDDKWLIPRIGNDALVSKVVALEDASEAEEPEYPMVETLLELAEKKRQEVQAKKSNKK